MEKEEGRHESFIQCDRLNYLVSHKIRSHNMLQYNLLFFFVVDKPVEVNVS